MPMMTPEQKEAREERIAIMTREGMSEEEAERYCDTKPMTYGIQERKEIQERLL